MSPSPRSAPTDLPGILRQLGPGLIVSAVIVGSGELIVTPKLGASVGYTLLWFIVLGCIIKVFVQLELGRFSVSRGFTTLETLNAIPGPRAVVSWLVWLWSIMFLATLCQVAGMVGGVASVLSLAGLGVSKQLLAIAIGAVTAVLLVVGRYRLIETLSTLMVAAFTFCTIVAVIALQFTPYAVTAADLAHGFSFRLPDSFLVAFAAFGIIGMGASELIYYPYWCLEKGYARHVGPRDGTPEWRHRARGWMRIMQVDAWSSCAIYTIATLAFYLLGAAILHTKGLNVNNADMIPVLSQMYQETFGTWSLWLFLVGAGVVLYSTIFVATASNTRLIADALAVFRLVQYRDDSARQRMVRRLCVIVPAIWVAVYLIWEAPVTLVFVGAVAQGIMLPFLAIAALWLHHRQTEPALVPGKLWRFLLWLAALCMIGTGGYQVLTEIGRLLP